MTEEEKKIVFWARLRKAMDDRNLTFIVLFVMALVLHIIGVAVWHVAEPKSELCSIAMSLRYFTLGIVLGAMVTRLIFYDSIEE